MKFMSTLKRKAHQGISGVTDKSFIMNGGTSFDHLVSQARALDEMSTKMSVVEQTRNLYGRKLAKKALLESPNNNDPQSLTRKNDYSKTSPDLSLPKIKS